MFGGEKHLPSPGVTLIHLHGQGGSLHTEGRAGRQAGRERDEKRMERKDER